MRRISAVLVVPALLGAVAVLATPLVAQARRPAGPVAAAAATPPLWRSSNAPPNYPDILRAGNVSGEVAAELEIDSAGRPDLATLRRVDTSERPVANDLLWAAVRQRLRSWQWAPARDARGRSVRARVRYEFAFVITDGTRRCPESTVARQAVCAPATVTERVRLHATRAAGS